MVMQFSQQTTNFEQTGTMFNTKVLCPGRLGITEVPPSTYFAVILRNTVLSRMFHCSPETRECDTIECDKHRKRVEGSSGIWFCYSSRDPGSNRDCRHRIRINWNANTTNRWQNQITSRTSVEDWLPRQATQQLARGHFKVRLSSSLQTSVQFTMHHSQYGRL